MRYELLMSRIFSIIALVMLIMAVVVLWLWPRSYLTYDVLGREAYSGIGTELISVRGCIIFRHWNTYKKSPPPQEFGFSATSAASEYGTLMAEEFDIHQWSGWLARRGFITTLSSPYNQLVMFPHWAVSGILFIPAVVWFARLRRRRWLGSNNKCIACGYDLRASLVRCPECGTPIVRDNSAKVT